MNKEYRHQCEVRQVLRWRIESKQKVLDYLQAVTKARGEVIGKQLEADTRAQWNKGNRGKQDEWR